jgi:protoporphyrinogen oxidase
VGGGLTGISAALHLDHDYLLLESQAELGGLVRTEEKQGFRFDRTGHWLHLRDPYISQWIKGQMGADLVQVQRIARIYSHGRMTRYPFQANLYGLPPEVIHQCLMGAIEAKLRRAAGPRSGARTPENFEEYINYHFGRGIAEHFMIPYNAKLWGVHPREITSAWCGRFVPVPDLEQIVRGALDAGPGELGYNVEFLYPKQGGIGAVSRSLARQLDPEHVRCGAEVSAIDSKTRTVQVGGDRFGYHALVSTMPLPKLVARLVNAPDDVIAAAERLRATPVHYLNVATRRPVLADYHWVYVPELDKPCYRVGVYSNAVRSMAPEGCSSLYLELADRQAVIHDRERVVRDALQALVAMGTIASSEDVVFADLRLIDPAYVVYDEYHEESVRCIISYLESRRIYPRGRYGSWIYNAMEDSLLSGKEVAELINHLPVDRESDEPRSHED